MPFTYQTKRALDRHLQLAHPLASRDRAGLPTIRDFVKEYKTTVNTITKVRKCPEYIACFGRLTRKETKVLGEEFKELTLATKGKLREYADKAPDVLYKIMMDEKEKAPARISAAVEILDRDGRFAKVSRLMNVKEGSDGAPMLPEDAAAVMLDAMALARKPN